MSPNWIQDLLDKVNRSANPQPPAGGDRPWWNPGGIFNEQPGPPAPAPRIAFGPEAEAEMRRQLQAGAPAANPLTFGPEGIPPGYERPGQVQAAPGQPPAQGTIPTGTQQPTLSAMPQLGPAPTLPALGNVQGSDSQFQQLMAEAGYQGGRAGWLANPVGAVGNPEDRARGVQLANQAAAPYVAAAGQQEDPSRVLLGNLQAHAAYNEAQAKLQADRDRTAAENYRALVGGEAQLGAARLAQQGHVQGAEIAAKAGKHATFTNAMAGLLAAAAEGKYTPEQIQAFRSMMESEPGGAAAGTPGAPGAAPAAIQNPQQVLSQIQQAAQKSKVVGAAMFGPDGKPIAAPGIGQGNAFLDNLAANQIDINGPDFKQIMADMDAGKYGDPTKVFGALTRGGTQARFQIAPPIDPKTNKPLDFNTSAAQTPAFFDVADQGDKLYRYAAGPGTMAGRTLAMLGGSNGIPYRQVVFPQSGLTVDIDPTDLGQHYKNTWGTPASAETLRNRAAYFEAIVKHRFGQNKPK